MQLVAGLPVMLDEGFDGAGSGVEALECGLRIRRVATPHLVRMHSQRQLLVQAPNVRNVRRTRRVQAQNGKGIWRSQDACHIILGDAPCIRTLGRCRCIPGAFGPSEQALTVQESARLRGVPEVRGQRFGGLHLGDIGLLRVWVTLGHGLQQANGLCVVEQQRGRRLPSTSNDQVLANEHTQGSIATAQSVLACQQVAVQPLQHPT
mmetsp:Transcript_27445/g.69464  ORF Transcript_27445/g.69464 Transcript_27445/m.69464 type:complete len:206 (+) Transcript_27445:1036-1653(+)